MAKFFQVLSYFRNYWRISVFSVAMMSLFEIVDLAVPYTIGQILNVLSGQPIDSVLQTIVTGITQTFRVNGDRSSTLITLLILVAVISVGRAPIQPWLGPWFAWDTAFRARRDNSTLR